MVRKFSRVVLAALCLVSQVAPAAAQDANGIYGNVYGCKVIAPTSAAWVQLASQDMLDTSTGTALASGLFVSSLSLVSRDAWGGSGSHICLGSAATCPTSTTHAPRLDAGTAKTIEVRGVVSNATSMTAVSLRGTAILASNVEVCAHWRRVQ
jgi:hypothetical protein